MEQEQLDKIKAETDKYREVLSQLSDSPESIASMIALLCIKDTDLRDSLMSDGMTEENLAHVKKQVSYIYETFLKKSVPDLSWMDKVKFKFLKNTDTQYVIPLPHTG